MASSIQCPPGTRRIGMECVPWEGKQAGQSDIEYYKQFKQSQPMYDTPGQGNYTGVGTGPFHPMYGKSRSSSVLSTPLISEYSGPTPTGHSPGRAGGLAPFKISGAAAGQSGYDPGSLAHGYRVRETPKRIDAPFSVGDPYAQGGDLWNMGSMNRSDPYEGVDPTLLYDLRSRAAGGALVPPGYTAGPGRTTPSEGTMSMPDLLKAASISEGSPLGRFYGGGIPGGGAPPPGGIGVGGGAPVGGGGLFNMGALFGGGGVPAGGAPAGTPAGRGRGSKGGSKKSGGGSTSKSGGGGTSSGSGTRIRP